MCINSRIASLQQQKAEIDAKLLQLENLQIATEPLMVALSSLCQKYRENAPEELPEFVEQILAACQVKESALAIAQSAATGNEAAQEFAASAMNLAIEKRAAEAFEIQMQAAYAQPTTLTDEAPQEFTVEAADKFQAEMQKLGDSYQQIDKSVAEHLENIIGETTSIKEIFDSKGFCPTADLEDFDADEKYETYRNWDIYYSLPNGGIVVIGLYNSEYNQSWDADTEYIQEIDPTFPESLADFQEIVGWTRAVIDRVENFEAPGQQVLNLELPDPTAEQAEEKTLDDGLTEEEYEEAIAEELALDDDEGDDGNSMATRSINEWADITAESSQKISPIASSAVAEKAEQPDTEISEIRLISLFNESVEIPDMKMLVTMWSQLRTDGEFSRLAGVTFNFNSLPSGTRLFSTSQTRSEIIAFLESDLTTAEQIAIALATKWKQRQEEKTFPPQSDKEKKENESMEFVQISNFVGYFKRRDNGEIMAAYLGFSNKLPGGERAPTMAKSRANKWSEHLAGTFSIKAEVRLPKRLVSDNSKQPFAYEVKITGLAIGQLQKLAEEDFSLLPNEIAVPVVPTKIEQSVTAQPRTSTWSITLNGYSLQSGTEEEVKTRFNKECLTLGTGGNVAITLWRGTEIIEDYAIANFHFTQAVDFDEISPEFNVSWRNWSAQVWQSVTAQSAGKMQRTWRHNRLNSEEVVILTTKEAAAIHAVRRMQGFI